MGTYLMVGIASKIQMSKKEQYGKSVTRKQLEVAIGKKININKFTYLETNDDHNWEIKDEALDNVGPFLSAQLEMYNEQAKLLPALDEIYKLNGKQLKEYLNKLGKYDHAELTKSVYFHYETLWDYETVIDDESWDRTVEGAYELIRLFMDGKIIMECYNHMFHYFERTIALQKDKYPIADCVRVMITS